MRNFHLLMCSLALYDFFHLILDIMCFSLGQFSDSYKDKFLLHGIPYFIPLTQVNKLNVSGFFCAVCCSCAKRRESTGKLQQIYQERNIISALVAFICFEKQSQYKLVAHDEDILHPCILSTQNLSFTYVCSCRKKSWFQSGTEGTFRQLLNERERERKRPWIGG